MRRLVRLVLAAASVALIAAAPAIPPPNVPPAASAQPDEQHLSPQARQVLGWVIASGDNLELPFVIIDKAHARVFAFDRDGAIKGVAPGLLGLGRGDKSPAGIGHLRLADIAPAKRITPAGRFLASVGNDLGEGDILWVDYENAISLHRVVTGNSKERRLERLESASVDDNRISFGCINVPGNFFDGVILPLFNKANGLVYILPEATPLSDVFDLPAPAGAPAFSAGRPAAP